MTKVVNIKKDKCDIYVGRKQYGMHFGNPFTHLFDIPNTIRVADRAEAVLYFRDWLTGKNWHKVEPERRKWILEHLYELKDKTLGCFCKPSMCHGDVYVELLKNEYSRYYRS